MSDNVNDSMSQREKNMIFWASFAALTAAGVGFALRVMITSLWGEHFSIDAKAVGVLFGAALWPIAISMVVFSLIVDKIGYRISMIIACVLQAISIFLTITANSFDALWWACFVAGLGHGIIEACINPLCAAMYRKDKSKMLNILHASWPAGIVIGASVYTLTFPSTLGLTWDGVKWIFYLMLIPVILYGIMFVICRRYPVDERVEANISLLDMLKTFGGLGAFIVFTFISYEIWGQINSDSRTLMGCLYIGILGGLITGFLLKARGSWMFFVICLVMIPLAAAEIATDGWIKKLMEPALGDYAGWAIVLSAFIMMFLRFFAGLPLKFMSPPVLLMVSSLFSIIGLFWLSYASSLGLIVVAFVFYAIGQTFYWPTVLGFVSEQFPEGGAMTLNTVTAVGLLTVGIFGGPFLGAVQDASLSNDIAANNEAIVKKLEGKKYTPKVAKTKDGKLVLENGKPVMIDKLNKEGKKDEQLIVNPEKKFFGVQYTSINKEEYLNFHLKEINKLTEKENLEKEIGALKDKISALVKEKKEVSQQDKDDLKKKEESLNKLKGEVLGKSVDASARHTLRMAAVLPIIMALVFLAIFLYYKSKGGYKPVVLIPEDNSNS